MRCSVAVALGFILFYLTAFAAENENDQPGGGIKLDPKALGYIETGKWVQLSEHNRLSVPAIYTDSPFNTIGVVIIVPDIDDHPNSFGIIRKLRTQLPEYGWATLSLLPKNNRDQHKNIKASPEQAENTPEGAQAQESRQSSSSVGEPTDDYYVESKASILKAIKYLEKKKVSNIVLLGKGKAAVLVANFLNHNQPKFSGAIFINLYSIKISKQVELFSELVSKVSLLDIYGDSAIPEVVASGHSRYKRMRGAGRSYKHYEILGGNQDFIGQEAAVIKRVRIWLKSIAKSAPGGPVVVGQNKGLSHEA